MQEKRVWLVWVNFSSQRSCLILLLGRMGLKVKVHNLSRVKSKILAVSPVMDNLSC
jgi:hypothetical protein